MAKKRRKKFKSGFWILAFLLLAVLATLFGLFYAIYSGDKDIFNPPVSGGQKQTISCIDESVEAQRTMDAILLKQNSWQLVERWRHNKEVRIPETGANIQINERCIGVGVPESLRPDAAGEWLKKNVKEAGLVYVDGVEEKYNGKYDGFKCSIGMALKAGEGKRNFVVDTIHFYNNVNLGKSKTVVEKPKRRFSGKLAIVVDDCGTDIKSVRTLLNLDVPFSFSILPNKDFSSDVLSLINTKGHVALLHLPLEPLNREAISEGENTIMTDMSDKQIAEMTQKYLQGLYGVVGVNNHQGSRITADKAKMRVILSVLKKEGMFFMDSRTNSETIARDVARQMGVPTCMNDKFLDNSTDVETIKEEVYKVMEMAQRNGSAIAICHARPHTVSMWQTYLEEFKKTGITFVPVTKLLY